MKLILELSEADFQEKNEKRNNPKDLDIFSFNFRIREYWDRCDKIVFTTNENLKVILKSRE